MPNVSTTKIALTLCIGLVVGIVLPFALFLILFVIDGVVINVAYSRFNAAIGLNELQLSALLVPTEMTSLFFLARFNKIMAAAALFTAIISTAYVIYDMVTQPSFAPP
jgi:hypothetical protein